MKEEKQAGLARGELELIRLDDQISSFLKSKGWVKKGITWTKETGESSKYIEN